MILNEFILLFKSDSKQVAADVADLTKKIEALKDKGRGRSEQENKDLKEYQKNVKILNEELKQNQERYDNIAKSAEKAGQAVLLGFGGLAKSVLGSAATNSALQVQGNLIGVNAQKLREYGAAAESAGGSAEELIGYYNDIFTRNAAAGLKTKPIDQLFDDIRAQLKAAGNNPAQRSFVFQRFGVPQGVQPLLNLPDAQYKAARKQGADVADNLQKGADAAREFDKAIKEINQDFASVITAVTTQLTPAIKALEKAIAPILKSLAQNPGAALGAAGAGSIVAGYGSLAIGKSILKTLGIGAAGGAAGEAAGAAGLTGSTLGAGAILVGGALLAKAAYDYSSKHGFNAPKSGSLRTYSESVSDSDTPELAAQRARRGYADTLKAAKSNLSFASQSQIGTLSPSGGGNKNVDVKIGNITIQTNATDVTGIASSISSHLERQINNTISNVDDGVAY